MNYEDFIASKSTADTSHGFEPGPLSNHLFDWQAQCVAWACRKGRAALFEDTGLGKTIQQVEWAHQVCLHTNGNVIIFAPLCVSQQTVREAVEEGIGGALAARFRQNVSELIADSPSVEQIDAFLSRFDGLMQQPMTLH